MSPYKFGSTMETIKRDVEDGEEFVEVVEGMMALLESGDEMDFFGTEGWMKMSGMEE